MPSLPPRPRPHSRRVANGAVSDGVLADLTRVRKDILRCLRDASGGEHRGDDPRDDNDEGEEELERTYRCALCETTLARAQDRFNPGGQGAVQVHTNPAGMVFQIIGLRAVENVVAVSAPSDSFTWYPGYAWEIVICAGCSVHLGWRFSGAAEPNEFWGLLHDRVRMSAG